uniref:S1 motif domain-containing protein n=1 Tax=Alexandrium catenella TaxID=2925 RepID=A0A7S1L917_ALECA|mmetsp:Transcript_107547/g.286177  ORF Transcript_107547/g.286177 Transcript_107547/m.286177 type:complete len:260 (+) Transcript_107547:1-780(+)
MAQAVSSQVAAAAQMTRQQPGRRAVPRICTLLGIAMVAWTSSCLVVSFSHGAPRWHIRRKTFHAPRRAAGTDAGSTASESDASEEAGSGSVVLKRFTKGQKLKGTVTKILRSGIFVDVGAGRDGWVHVSKVGYGRVDSADELVAQDQELTLWVTKPNNARLELSCRPPVDLSGFEGIPANQWISGTVSAVDYSGLYVAVQLPGGGEPQQGKVRRREIRKGWVKNPFKEAEMGEEVRVRVIGLNVTAGRLDLTMRGIQDP